MAMLETEYEHYISLDRDFSTPSANGGAIGNLVVPDSLNVIFPEVLASEREVGLVRYSKVFMKNASADRKMLNNIFFVKQDLLPPDRIRLIEATSPTSHQSDENFGTAKKYINSVIVEGLTNGLTTLVIPRVDAPYFEVLDHLVIVDGYYRTLYRGSATEVQDHATNVNASVVTLSTPYVGVTIPALEAFLCNGVKDTLAPGETKSFWLELEIAQESAIDSEVINQFQTGASFDDVSAI